MSSNDNLNNSARATYKPSAPELLKQISSKLKKHNKHKSDLLFGSNFVLDCCKISQKLPYYDSVNDKYLMQYFHTKKEPLLKHIQNQHKANSPKSRVADPIQRSKTDLSKRNILTFQEKQILSISKRLQKSQNKLTTSIEISKPVVLPEIMATQRSRAHLEKLINYFGNKSMTHKHSKDALIGKTQAPSHNEFKPLSKQEFMSTINKLKKAI